MEKTPDEIILQICYPRDLDKIYTGNSYLNRYKNLIDKFSQIYNFKPSFIARAPGRVNLIGEHIDYEGFAVLPMAIENDILIAVNYENREGDTELTIHHIDSEKYSPYCFNKVNYFEELKFVSPHNWINYVIAGHNSIMQFIKTKTERTSSQHLAINLLFTGNIPTAAGLSSSSALTVASALAVTRVYNLENSITKNELADVTINFERTVGTACGGMDQTISIYAEKDKAKLIEFIPNLQAKTVNLPTNVSFVIANSLTDSYKIDTLAFRFNKRVVENKLGLAIICKKLNLNIQNTLNGLKLTLGVNFEILSKIIKDNLKSGGYTIEEIKNESINIDDVLKNIPYYNLVLNMNNTFILRERLLHVCEESERVLQFHRICSEDNSETLHLVSDNYIKELGSLMNLSHKSCKELYDCSSNELDELVAYALENKAEGARLTGAGWGGCTVIMVKNENLEYLIEKLKIFYQNKLNEDEIDKTCFKTKASQGVCILNI